MLVRATGSGRGRVRISSREAVTGVTETLSPQRLSGIAVPRSADLFGRAATLDAAAERFDHPGDGSRRRVTHGITSLRFWTRL
jgi:hypothetical protein